MLLLNYLFTTRRIYFQIGDFRKYQDSFRLIENFSSLTTTNVAEPIVFGYEARYLEDEMIDLNHDTQLKFSFKLQIKEKDVYRVLEFN